jgi:hypothetical protein
MSVEKVSNSFRTLFKNPILFVPDLFYILLSYLGLLLLSYYTGFAEVLPLLESGGAGVLDTLKSYVSENLFQLISSTVIFVIFTFVVGVGALSFRYELIKQIIKKEKVSLIRAWKEKRGKVFWNVVFLRILVFLASLVLVIIISLASGLVYLIINPFSNTLAITLTSLVGVFLTILALILLKLGILFRYPVLFLNKKHSNAWKAIKESISLFRKKPYFVFRTLIIIFIVNIILMIIAWIFNFAFGLTQTLTIPFLVILFTIIIGLINTFIDLTSDLWSSIFLFSTYNKKK